LLIRGLVVLPRWIIQRGSAAKGQRPVYEGCAGERGIEAEPG
jgi:hypothetical protein